MKILLIKPGAMGDLLHLTPAIRAMLARWPGARITVIVGTDESARLFQYHPAVAETIVYEWWGRHKSLAGFWQFLRGLLQREPFDLVVNYQRSNLRTWFMAMAARPVKMRVYNKTRKPVIHAVLDHIQPLESLGVVPPAQLRLELVPGPEAERFAAEVWQREGLADAPVAAINPGASHPVNRWSTRQFADLADMLIERLAVRVIVVGGGGDCQLAEEIAGKARHSLLLLTGKTSMLQLGAVLARCAVLVSGDTGPMHMATAVGTPVVALFGAADPARTGPVGGEHLVLQARDVSCVPCRSRTCTNADYLACMQGITVDEVFTAVARQLQPQKDEPCAS